MPNFNPFKRNKRAGTTSVFDDRVKPRTETVSHQVSEQTEQAKEANKTDLAIETSKGKDPEAEGPSTLKPRIIQNEDKLDETQRSYGTTTHEIDQDEVTLAYFDAALSYKMVQTSYPQISYYVPNAMPLITILEQALRLMGASSYLGKFYSNFCPYAVITGYCYMFHFQILKAKEKSGQLDGYERNVYNRFFKTYSEESIPIPDILYPYIQSIVATKFNDVKYSWIVPTITNRQDAMPLTFSTAGSFRDQTGIGKCVPNIPAMLMMLASFGSETQGDLANKVDGNGIYTPVALAGSMNLFGLGAASFDFTTAGTATAAGDQFSIFQTCGLSSPFRFYNGDFDNARRAIQNSSFFGLKGVNFSARATPADLPNETARVNAVDFANFDQFMNMQKEKNLAFFEYLLENMLIFCKFFPAKRNFSQIKGTGGLETTILTSLRTSVEYGTGANAQHLHVDLRCGVDTVGNVRWYPRLFNEMTANFLSSKAGISRPQELLALTFGTISTPPIRGLTIRNFRRGKYYEDVNEHTKKYEIGDFNSTGAGSKPMYQTFSTEVLTRYLVTKPT